LFFLVYIKYKLNKIRQKSTNQMSLVIVKEFISRFARANGKFNPKEYIHIPEK